MKQVRCFTRHVKAFIVLASATALSATLGMSRVNAEIEIKPSAEQKALAQATCLDVMRIKQGYVPFDACVESLSQTLVIQTQKEILVLSYRDCLAAGHGDGSSDMATCVLEREAVRSAGVRRAPGGAGIERTSIGGDAESSKPASYAESSPQERRRKEEYSCARLALLPGSVGFSECVAHLDAALQAVEHPD